MNGFRMNSYPDVSITRNEWDHIGRQNMITEEISRALGMTQSLEETRGNSEIASPLMEMITIGNRQIFTRNKLKGQDIELIKGGSDHDRR